MTIDQAAHGAGTSRDDDDLAGLVRACRAGDARAWERLVTRFEPLVRGTARRCLRDEADVADAVQNTWLRLLTGIGGVQEPERLAGWLATTAGREALRLLQRRGREVPYEVEALPEATDQLTPDPAQAAADGQLRQAVRSAVDALPEQPRRMLWALGTGTSYVEVAQLCGMPVGSIGPTRARRVAQLRAQLTELGYASAS